MSRTAAFLFLAAFVVQTVTSMRLLSASSDETTHLPAGYTYVRTGDFRLNPQHPPLAKLLAAAPLLALEPKLELDSKAWTSTPPDEWNFGRHFLYSNDADRLLQRAVSTRGGRGRRLVAAQDVRDALARRRVD